jgi:PadR family transcriptional regulator, regulatory protein AphA
METIRLGPTSYLVLGMVAVRGPSTPYELKRAVARSVGNFWPFPHAQFYAEPARLTAAGLLTATQEQAGRHRRLYTITEAGLQAVRTWLAEPATDLMEIRDIGELKLFFSELTDESDIIALARAQEHSYRARLAELELIEDRFGDDPTRIRRMAPLRLGRAIYLAAAEFWAEVAQNPPSLPDSGAASTRPAATAIDS